MISNQFYFFILPNQFYLFDISDHTREGAIKTSERLRLVSGKITESYVTIKRTLTTLHEQYEESKSERNIIRKYSLFKVNTDQQKQIKTLN